MTPNTKTPTCRPVFAFFLPFFLIPAAYTGFACLSSPCVYGICLDDLNSSFTCYCMDGYTGTLCQTNWDDCWSSPCENGATCTDGVASFNCTCPDGFTGELCESNVNECASNPCLNNATCLDGNNGYLCLCEPGYYGQRCEQDMAVCNVTTDGEPRCHNGGVCRDGPGEAFYCDCAPGWTGKICDDPIDECSSNPCQHGGVCIDLHNAFACACLFGYTGNDCSLVLEPCRANVCENGALCLLEGGDRQHVCYCVPDFHGPRCQYRYDECLAGPGCRNGGLCIDGIDEYSCSCPPQLTGDRCECLNSTEGELDCSYEAPSTISPFPWRYNTSTESAYTTTLQSFITSITTSATTGSEPRPETTEGPSKLSPETDQPGVTYPGGSQSTGEPTEAHTDVSVFLWTTQPSGVMTEVMYPPSTPVSLTTVEGSDIDSRSSDITIPGGHSPAFSGGTTSKEPIESRTTDSLFYTTEVYTPKPRLNDTVTTSKSETTLPDPPTLGSSPEVASPVSLSEVPELTTEPASPAETTEVPTSQIPSSNALTTEHPPIPRTTPQWFTSGGVTTDRPDSRSSPEEVSPTPSIASTDETSTDEAAGFSSTIVVPVKPATPNLTSTTRSTTPSPPAFNTTSPRTTLSILTQTPESVSSATVLAEFETSATIFTAASPNKTTSTTPSSITTSVPNTTDTTEVTTTSMNVTTKSSSTFTSTSTPVSTISTAESTKTSVKLVPTTVSTDVSETVWPIIPSESPIWINGTGTDVPYTGDCPEKLCQNGGSCIDGTRCACSFGWTGLSCDQRLAIKVPAFNGHSFLAHQLPNASVATGVAMGFVAKTVSSNGLLVHAVLTPDVYMSAYLEDGLLRFQFSCGVQTMLFNELQRRVDDGRELVVNVSLTVRPVIAFQNSSSSSAKMLRVNARLCAASLRVNHTLAMSGEQTAILGRIPNEVSSGLLLLGGLPLGGGRAASLVEPLPDPPLPGGFSGCVRDLQINGQSRRVYEDAIDGAEISECSDLACLSSPCHGGATCAQSAEGWTCLCPPGMVGRQCERSICLNNPCQYGGTCVTFPGSGFLCLCPLGKRGMFCEYDLDITVPKFSPIGGLSSYASYVLPTSIDWNLELRIRFLPTHVDQVALLLFIGQTGQHGPLSDHLALSYIQGHVLLTWNLGSGVRRIYTRRPVPRPPSGRPHYVRIGRVGRVAWLKVDGMENITGESLPSLDRLNVRPLLFVGRLYSHPVTRLDELQSRMVVRADSSAAGTGSGNPYTDRIEGDWHMFSDSHNVPPPLQDERQSRQSRATQSSRGPHFTEAYINHVSEAQVSNTVAYLCRGHSSINFSQLPHDLPLHRGFHGCVASIELLIGNNRIPLVGSGGSGAEAVRVPATYAVAGRAVGQCETSVCTPKSCEHGICLQHGPAFVCVCQDGWFGPTCAARDNPCDEERNACAEGSTCVPTPSGYECDCRLGRSGRYCEQDEQLSDVFLSGRRSFLEVAAVDIQRSPVCLQLEIRPSEADGLLLLVGHPFPDAPYLALSLWKSVLVASLSSARSWPLVIRSTRVVGNHAMWHLVRLCRSGRLLTLTVDGTDTKAILRPGDRFPSQGAPLFIGGLPDMSALPAVAGESTFKGCVRRLSQNQRPLPLDMPHLVDGRNVVDCDGTRCGGDVCFNGGTCSLRKDLSDPTAVCQCPQEYTGSRCETQLRCPHLTCKNGGRCVQRPGELGECHCPLQWTGPLCGHRTSLGTPLHFPGNAYLLVRSEDSSGRQRKTRGHENELPEPFGGNPIGFISLNYSTTSEDGMILWTREADQWVGIGLRQNNFSVLWGWREEGGNLSDFLEIDAPTDGSWVTVNVQLGPDRVAIWRNDSEQVSSSSSSFPLLSQETLRPLANGPTPSRQWATDGTFYIGGFPGNDTISTSTNGIFSLAFIGCIASLQWRGNSVLSDLSTAEGENVEACHNLQFRDWRR